MTNFDVIVIGGGHNGLTTAALLGQAGKRVLVLEKNERLGGLAMPEVFHPDYTSPGVLHDTGGIRLDLIDTLNLRSHGVLTTGKRAPITLLGEGGEAITLQQDIEATARSIAQVSQQDAEAYRRYRTFLDKVSPWIRGLVSQTQPNLATPNLREVAQLAQTGLGLRRLGKETMQELLKVLPMCVADFLNEYFETDILKVGLAGPALLSTFNGPWSSFTTINLMLWEATQKEQVVGGPPALIDALADVAKIHRVEIRTEAEVANIELNGEGEVKGVRLTNGDAIPAPLVAASCSPKSLFLDLLSSRQIGPKLEAEILHLRCRGVTAKVNLALDKKVQWTAQTDSPIEFARTGGHFDAMERAFDAAKYRRYSEKPVLDIFVPTVSNSNLAPKGHEVVSILAQYAPHDLEGGWTEEAKEAFGDRVIEQLALYTKDLESSIVARQVLTPSDLEGRFNLPGGHLFHAEHAVDQLVGRPVPSCASYETPIPGLYLCGSGSHPGGGLTCAPGALASKAILASKRTPVGVEG